MRDGAGLSLEALDADVWPDREPLEAHVDRRERIERRLLFDAIDSAASLPNVAPAWMADSGMLPTGGLGEYVWKSARERADAVLIEARKRLGAQPMRLSQGIDLSLPEGLRLRGVVERAYRINEDKWCVFDAKPGNVATFSELIALYLDYAALRLGLDREIKLEFVECAKKAGSAPKRPALLDAIVAQTPAQLREGLSSLIQVSRDSLSQPLLFFPKTAWAWANAKQGKRESDARSAWESADRTTGERDYTPGYAALLTRDMDLFDANSPEHASFVASIELVAAVLDPEHRVLLHESIVAPKPTASPPKKRVRKS